MLTTTDTAPHKAASSGIFTPRTFNRRTRQRFSRIRTRALVAHLGHAPSYPERIIIDRIVAIEWELRRLDAKLDEVGSLSPHDARTRLAAENRLRLDLVALGLKAAPPPVPTLQDVLRQIEAESEMARRQREASRPADGSGGSATPPAPDQACTGFPVASGE